MELHLQFKTNILGAATCLGEGVTCPSLCLGRVTTCELVVQMPRALSGQKIAPCHDGIKQIRK